ncbi:hypothetical protein ACFQ1S_35590, partial [Kibdelosporangium lantanae]
GVLLEWKLTRWVPGVLPFLIDWGTTPHPSRDAVHGSTLLSFHITPGTPPGLMARIGTPQGEVTLR